VSPSRPAHGRRCGETPSIVACGVTKAYAAGAERLVVLNGVDISVYPGELTLLLGPSGSGKSTLLSALSGLLAPDSGSVTVDGTAIWSMTPADLERFRLERCGFVFQGFNLFPALTALEQVQVVLEQAGLPARQARVRSWHALDEVGLTRRAHVRPAELSGGEKQRVAIARALAKRPRLLFADEPTSSLDSVNGQLVIGLLLRAARARGATVLCVTHDPRLLGHADRIMRMEDGRLILDQRAAPAPPPEEIL